MLPWTDRTGHFAPLRALTLLLVCLPAVWLAVESWQGWLGSRPITEAIHQAGLWAIRLLAVSLAITPLRVASRQTKLVSIRRMLGLSVLCYALLHFALYIYNQHFDAGKIVWEIATRIYLLIGFVALCGLAVLGSTSTDGMVRRLGAVRWTRLHRLVYPIAVLGVVHFFMQSKLDETQPFIMAGIALVLLFARLGKHWTGDLSPVTTVAIAVGAAALTGAAEAAWYAVKTGTPFDLILAANLDFTDTIRPAWYGLAAGTVLVVARLARPLLAKPARRPATRPTDAGATDRFATERGSG